MRVPDQIEIGRRSGGVSVLRLRTCPTSRSRSGASAAVPRFVMTFVTSGTRPGAGSILKQKLIKCA